MSTNVASPARSTPEEHEKQLCLSCLSPNSPIANFCADCGAPLSSYAATGPLEHVFAEGHLYRRAVEEPRSILVVIGVWLLFGMTAAMGLMPLLDRRAVGMPGFLLSALLVPISLVVIWRTTSRYLSRKTSPPGSPVRQGHRG